MAVELRDALYGVVAVKRPAHHVGQSAQLAIIDVVFSIDSVFTAVGLVQQLEIMVIAIVLAVLFMMWVSGGIGRFIAAHPTLKILALAFLILIGVALIAEALEFHIPKGYLYFSVAFALAVELLNTRLGRGAGSGPRGTR